MIGVFLKYPEPGKVKTRLAHDVGDVLACSLYEKMIRLVYEKTLRPGKLPFLFFCDPYRPIEDYRRYFASWPVELRMQEGENLGERMSNALSDGGILIGTDCLDISPELLAEADRQLQDADLVLGPASDGGYYLIGMRHHLPQVFQGVEWSSSEVLAQTLSKAANLKVHLLEKRSDIDTWQDLEARAREKGGGVDRDSVLTDLIM